MESHHNQQLQKSGIGNVLDGIFYLIAFAAILWYIRWWWRTTHQLKDTLFSDKQSRIQRSNMVQNIGQSPLSHYNDNKYIYKDVDKDGNEQHEGFIDIASESNRVGPPNSGPFRNSDNMPETKYSKRCYSRPIDRTAYRKMSKLPTLNADSVGIDEQETGSGNGVDISHNILPRLITPPNSKPGEPGSEHEFQKDRRYRNRDQQLQKIAEQVKDRTRLSEDDYRAKYAWHDSASRCLRLPPGFGKLTPRKTEDGTGYEYAYTGDIRDAQLRTPMDILADYPKKEWACNRPYQQCTAPAHLIGNAPEYYRRIQRQIDRSNAAEQWQQSVAAQLPPQHLPPTYPG